MGHRLNDERVCYAHRWQTGDVVIADNFTLLHGRRAFAHGTCATSAALTFSSSLKLDILKLSGLHAANTPSGVSNRRDPNSGDSAADPSARRWPFEDVRPLGRHPHSSCCLPLATWSTALRIRIWMLFTNLICPKPFWFGCAVRYFPSLGKCTTRLLCPSISWTMNRWIFLVMVAIGVVLGAAYSVKPVQLKDRRRSNLLLVAHHLCWPNVVCGVSNRCGYLTSGSCVRLCIRSAADGSHSRKHRGGLSGRSRSRNYNECDLAWIAPRDCTSVLAGDGWFDWCANHSAGDV